jgi:hypothetical protein
MVALARTLWSAVFVALNSALRRQRRAMVAVMLGLAGAVVTAHSVTAGDHMGDGVVMCLAVAETGVVAIGAALVVGVAVAYRPHWSLAVPSPGASAYVPGPRSVPGTRGSAAAAGFPAVSSSV